MSHGQQQEDPVARAIWYLVAVAVCFVFGLIAHAIMSPDTIKLDPGITSVGSLAMTYIFSVPARENLMYALPDTDVFYIGTPSEVNRMTWDSELGVCPVCGEVTRDTGFTTADGRTILSCTHAVGLFEPGNIDSEMLVYTGPGWYYAYGSPGYLWDSGPYGPYPTETAAISAARAENVA